MTIDFNTLSIVILGGFTAFFAISFFRSILRERKVEISNRINEVEDTMWKENDKMWQRINSLERVCQEQTCRKEYPVKNHYNTGV